MKEMKCIDCDEKFSTETKDEMMQKMMPHYKSDHKDIMESGTKEGKEEWMKKFGEAWDKAEEKE